MKRQILTYLIHLEFKRIARGSGWPESEVKELVKNYKNSKNLMKASKGRQMQGTLRKMGLG